MAKDDPLIKNAKERFYGGKGCALTAGETPASPVGFSLVQARRLRTRIAVWLDIVRIRGILIFSEKGALCGVDGIFARLDPY